MKGLLCVMLFVVACFAPQLVSAQSAVNPCKATAVAPTYVEGASQPCSVDLSGGERLSVPPGGIPVGLQGCIRGEPGCDPEPAENWLMVTGSLTRTVLVTNSVTANGTGAAYQLPSGAKTPMGQIVGAAAVTGTIEIYGKNDTVAAGGVKVCTLTMSGNPSDFKTCSENRQFTGDFTWYYNVYSNTTGSPTYTLTVGMGLVTNGEMADGATPCVHISTASTNAVNCLGSAGRILFGHFVNTTSTLAFLRLYNLSTAPTCSSATGFVESIPIPHGTNAGSGVSFNYSPTGQAFSTGVGFCITGGGAATDNTNSVASVYVKLGVK